MYLHPIEAQYLAAIRQDDLNRQLVLSRRAAQAAALTPVNPPLANRLTRWVASLFSTGEAVAEAAAEAHSARAPVACCSH